MSAQIVPQALLPLPDLDEKVEHDGSATGPELTKDHLVVNALVQSPQTVLGPQPQLEGAGEKSEATALTSPSLALDSRQDSQTDQNHHLLRDQNIEKSNLTPSRSSQFHPATLQVEALE